MLQENCYIISDETQQTVIIDCGAYYVEERESIINYIDNQDLKPVHLLCTHGHFDHCFGNDTIWKRYGLKPEVGEEDAWLMDIKGQMQQLMGTNYSHESPPVGHFLLPNETIKFGNHQLAVLPTPGHTPGGVTFYCAEEKTAFTGDTLFHLGIGRTDFERGSWQQLQQSLSNVIAKLPGNTIVYSGHGPQTTIGYELRHNPYLQGFMGV